jgi:hypothetical protein
MDTEVRKALEKLIDELQTRRRRKRVIHVCAAFR